MLRQINPPLRLGKVLNPATPIRAVIAQRTLFVQLVHKNISARFRHSVLGVLWLFFPPLCVLMLYVYVFSIVFKMRWPESEVTSPWHFGLVIFCGITVFSAFSESVMGSISVVINHSNYVKRVPFPLEFLPASHCCSAFIVNSLVLLLVLAVSLIGGGGWPGWNLAVFPLVLIPLFLLGTGCAWGAAALGVFRRDIGNLAGIVMMVLFFTAPVFYSARMVPEQYQFILDINPLTPIICNTRNILLFQAAPDWGMLIRSWLTGAVIFQAGYFCFAKMRRKFADVL